MIYDFEYVVDEFGSLMDLICCFVVIRCGFVEMND